MTIAPWFTHACHWAAAGAALLACILTFASGARWGGFWWALVHLALAAAAGLGGYVDPASMTAAWLQCGALVGAIFGLIAEERHDPANFPMTLWLFVQGFMWVGSGGARIFGDGDLDIRVAGAAHIGALIIAWIANGLDNRTATPREKWANRMWSLVQIFIAFGSGAPNFIIAVKQWVNNRTS